MTTCVLLSMLLMAETLPDSRIVGLFEPHQCYRKASTIRYRLYRPQPTGRSRLPLLVWFHGRGEAGRDNTQQLAWLELLLQRDTFPAYVVALQRPAESPSWSGPWTQHRDSAFADVDAVVDDLLATELIDPDRLILAGISSGGSAVWHYAKRHPHRFAALVPLATTIPPTTRDGLTRTPIWAFQSTGDGIDSVRRMREFVGMIEDAGGMTRLTVVPSRSHDCWTEAFVHYPLRDWMLAQRRGCQVTSPLQARRSTLRPSQLGIFLALLGVLLCAGLVFTRARRTISLPAALAISRLSK